MKLALLEEYLSRRADLKRFLTARLGSEDGAEDVLQNLYLKVARVAATGEDIRNPGAYLFTMALNLSHSHRRERLRTRRRDGQWVETSRFLVGSEAVADIPAVDRAYDAKQRIAQIMVVLEQLSPQCRTVFQLHKLDGLSHAEIASRLGISRSTIEKHMTTALKQLLSQLRDEHQ